MVLVACAIWSAGIGLQILAPSYEAKVLIFQLWVSASWPVGVFWFVFVVYYTGRDHWLTPLRMGAIVGFVVLIMSLALTNNVHWLIWQDYALLTDQYQYPVLAAERTTLYYAFLIVAYSLPAIGLFLLFKFLVTARHASAWQTTALLVGSGAVFGVNILYHSSPPRTSRNSIRRPSVSQCCSSSLRGRCFATSYSRLRLSLGIPSWRRSTTGW